MSNNCYNNCANICPCPCSHCSARRYCSYAPQNPQLECPIDEYVPTCPPKRQYADPVEYIDVRPSSGRNGHNGGGSKCTLANNKNNKNAKKTGDGSKKGAKATNELKDYSKRRSKSPRKSSGKKSGTGAGGATGQLYLKEDECDCVPEIPICSPVCSTYQAHYCQRFCTPTQRSNQIRIQNSNEIEKCLCRRSPIRPCDNLTVSHAPMECETEYKSAYRQYACYRQRKPIKPCDHPFAKDCSPRRTYRPITRCPSPPICRPHPRCCEASSQTLTPRSQATSSVSCQDSCSQESVQSKDRSKSPSEICQQKESPTCSEKPRTSCATKKPQTCSNGSRLSAHFSKSSPNCATKCVAPRPTRCLSKCFPPYPIRRPSTSSKPCPPRCERK